MADFIPAGLAQSPKPVFLFVSSEHSSAGWHKWDYLKDEPIPVTETGVYGRLVFIEEAVKVFKKKDNHKLRFHIYNGPLRFIVESGRHSTFSKGIIASLLKLGPQHSRRLLCIAPEPGSEDKVVFGNVYDADTGRKVWADETASDDAAQDEMIERVYDFIKKYERKSRD